MTFYYRHNGQWIEATAVHEFHGGGGGGGNVGSRFYTDGPPTRSGATITYDGNSHSSLQAAVESLNEDETLYIDPVNDPYVERLNLSTGNIADHISIVSDGELSVDSRGAPTVEQSGARVRRPDTDYRYAIGSGSSQDNGIPTDASIDGSHGHGDTTLTVDDSAPFSVGDVIWIEEDRVPYGMGNASGGSYHPDITTEMREITDISGNDLELNHQILLPFPDTNATSVGVVPFFINDLHISGLHVQGDRGSFLGDSSDDGGRPLYIRMVKDLWVDHTEVSDSTFHGSSFGRCYRPRLDRVFAHDCPDRYGSSFIHVCSHTHVTNFSAENINRYAVRIAHTGGGRGSSDALVDGVYGVNFAAGNNAVVNSHFGGFFVENRNVYSDDVSAVSRIRSHHLTTDGFTKVASGGPQIIFAQRTDQCEVKNGTVDRTSDSGYVFKFYMPDGPNSPRDNAISAKHSNILFENIDISEYGGTPASDIGHFDIEGDPVASGPMTFKNVTYAGEPLTESDVTSWDGYDPNYVQGITVE